VQPVINGLHQTMMRRLLTYQTFSVLFLNISSHLLEESIVTQFANLQIS
jgi:hypothetical protein